jgi:iron complex transport system ATP-binding protein
MQHLLSSIDLCVGYKGKPLVSNLSFSLCKGEVTALLGSNGVGKSTLLRTITGELPIISGSVLICGKPISSYSRKELARTVAIVTTERIFAGGLTVRELVSLGRHPHTGALGRFSVADYEIIDAAMKAVSIEHKSDTPLAELSDGERQKSMLARAIAQETPLIIMDEPFSFLDVAARIDILSLLKRIAHSEHKGILFSSHDVAQALRMADNLWLLTPNRKFVSGTPANLIESGAIKNLFSSASIKFDPIQNDFVL